MLFVVFIRLQIDIFMKLVIPGNYRSSLTLKETERAIKMIKDFFEMNLAAELKLRRVTAPLFVQKGTGINDDLNGTERPVSFQIRDMEHTTAEIVHSLAKWKRMMLADYEIANSYGIYTDMNALRPDEELDNTHSVYVDQWDWEKIMRAGQRNLGYLKETVNTIYEVLKETEAAVSERYSHLERELPKGITFVHSEELKERYPKLAPRQRETEVTREYGAVFVIGIGGDLGDGEIHDGRAPDYDDWITPTEGGRKGLNGDILLWYPLLGQSVEISSMGIRVDGGTLMKQLDIRGETERAKMEWHQRLLNGGLPQSIGGGIGQSRLCMFYLKKMHVGEVHASVWPSETVARCRAAGIPLL